MLLNVVYLLVALVALPWVIWRRVSGRRPVAAPGRRFTGSVNLAPPEPGLARIWLHGVSVGEVQLLAALAAELAQQAAEVGGKIGFAGTDRFAQSATVQMRTGPNGSAAIAGNVTLTLNFYSINVDGTIGSTLGSRTQTFASPAGSGSTNTTYRPYYDATFDLSSLSLTLPNQVYFGVALLTPGLDATTQSTNISLWCYGTSPSSPFSTADSTFDGSVIKTGTDLSNSVWIRGMNGTVSNPDYSGFTPNLTVNAVPAPGALALLGVAGLAGGRRRRA